MRQKPKNRIMALIAQGKLSRKVAATELGVSTRTINRYMLDFDVARPPSQRARERDRKLLREQSRRQIIRDTWNDPIKVTAKLLDVCTRTAQRYKEKYGAG